MTATLARFALLLCLAVGLAAVLVRQHTAQLDLQAERDGLLAVQREQARLAAEKQRLAAALVSADELARLRALRDQLDRGRTSIAQLKRALAEAKGQPLPPAPPTPAKPKPEADKPKPPLTGPRIPATEWQFAGTASPSATFQSVVWSATRGETDQLAPLLTFDAPVRQRLEEGFARLSDETRAQYGSPEKLVATLIAVQVPQNLGAFGVVADLTTNTGDVAVVMRLERRPGSLDKDATFIFRQDTTGWRLVVPAKVVADFERALTGPPQRPFTVAAPGP